MEDETKEAITAYCLRCKEKRVMQDPEFSVSKSQMKMAKGTCPECGCKMSKILGKAKDNESER